MAKSIKRKKKGTEDIPISGTFWNMKGCSVNLDEFPMRIHDPLYTDSDSIHETRRNCSSQRRGVSMSMRNQ